MEKYEKSEMSFENVSLVEENKDLQCPICYNVMVDAVMLLDRKDGCQHNVCQQCSEKIMSCPLCKETIVKKLRNMALERQCRSALLRCNECKEEGTFKTIKCKCKPIQEEIINIKEGEIEEVSCGSRRPILGREISGLRSWQREISFYDSIRGPRKNNNCTYCCYIITNYNHCAQCYVYGGLQCLQCNQGVLDKNNRCLQCQKSFCVYCMEISDNNHQCSILNLLSIIDIKEKCKICSRCGYNLIKIDGCERITCSNCQMLHNWDNLPSYKVDHRLKNHIFKLMYPTKSKRLFRKLKEGLKKGLKKLVHYTMKILSLTLKIIIKGGITSLLLISFPFFMVGGIIVDIITYDNESDNLKCSKGLCNSFFDRDGLISFIWSL